MKKAIHVKYLMTNEQDLLWGLTISTVGFQHIEVDSVYPPQNHPTRYLFSTHKGRVLDDYQLVYITQGQGNFISSHQKRTDIKAGHVFLLFPGEWHNYQPVQEKGWDEYWIGFKGTDIDNRISNGFFNKNKPILNVGTCEEMVHLYRQAIGVAEEQNAGFQPMLAGILNHLLSITYFRNKSATFENMKVTEQINKAKIIMLENFHTDMLPESIASSVCMGYSWFRRVFKEYTGLSPYQYIQELRIQKGKELLTNTMHTSQEIAFEIGFDNPDYFCTAFKKATGSSPLQFREFTQGKNL